jgi:GTP-binding protein
MRCEWNGVEFELIDTGGMDLAAEDSLSRSVQDQARAAIADADAVLLVLDTRAGLRPGDAEVAEILRRSDRAVIVVANKVDDPGVEPLVAELFALGLGDPVAVSATQGLGTGDLLDRLAELARNAAVALPEAAEEPVAVALIGRPNAGKSSLFNAFLGADRVIVSELAGTTRDAIDTDLVFDDRPLRLVDTAGLRRRTKVAGTVDYYAQIRSEHAAERADVAIVICDAADGVTAEDLRVAELAMRTGCATLVALNKWDLIEGEDADAVLADARARIGSRVRQRPPVIACSAVSRRSVPKLLATAVDLADRRAERIPTPGLNRFVGDVVAAHPPPARRAGKRLRLYYAAQVGDRPPRIAIQVNDRRLITRDWAYHLENRLREHYRLEGVPLVIDFVPKRKRSEQR